VTAKECLHEEGNQSDKIDARRLASCCAQPSQPVYHGEHGLRSLKELVRIISPSPKISAVMSRVKHLSQLAFLVPASSVCTAPSCEWLGKITEPGVRRRAEFYYQQLDALRTVRQQVRRELLAEGKKHQAGTALPDSFDRPIRSPYCWHSADPHRFRTKRQLWTYSGFGIETQSSADHRSVTAARTSEETELHSRTEPQLQSRSEESV